MLWYFSAFPRISDKSRDVCAGRALTGPHRASVREARTLLRRFFPDFSAGRSRPPGLFDVRENHPVNARATRDAGPWRVSMPRLMATAARGGPRGSARPCKICLARPATAYPRIPVTAIKLPCTLPGLCSAGALNARHPTPVRPGETLWYRSPRRSATWFQPERKQHDRSTAYAGHVTVRWPVPDSPTTVAVVLGRVRPEGRIAASSEPLARYRARRCTVLCANNYFKAHGRRRHHQQRGLRHVPLRRYAFHTFNDRVA